MSKLKNIAYDCRRATLLIEKQQLGGLTLQERAALVIHLTGCSVCRLYQQQSVAINEMIKKLFITASPRKLDNDFKKSLEKQINERLP
jgi:hypothetical protein